MNSIINIEELRELLRKYKAKEFLTISLVFMAIAILQLVLGGLLSILEEDAFIEAGIWLLIPAGIMVILFVIFYSVYKNIQRKPFDNKIFQTYKNYESKGTAIPIYRVVSYGRSSETIYMILDIFKDEFEIFDIRRKGLNPYLKGSMNDITFKFFYKEKSGIDILKPRVHMISSVKKMKLQGMTEVLDRFIVFLKSEGYHIDIEHK